MFISRSSRYERQLTPAKRFRNNTRFTTPPAHQSQSPLFALPAEIRQLIFKELFGSRLVHIFFRQRGEKFGRAGAPGNARIPGFVHCVCRRERGVVPHYHEEKSHKWCFLSTSLLKTCQSAYIEGIPILYQTNTLSFRCPRDIVFFQAQVETFSKLAQAIDLHCAKTSCRDELPHHNTANHPWALPRGQFDAYFEMMWSNKDLAISARHVRLYFETEQTDDFYVAFNVRTLLRSDVVPAAQIQVFLQGNSNSMVDESIKLTSTPDKRRRIAVSANTKISECHGEVSGED
ncbi:hypothetical protein BKA59DRAFT_465984 [Fusarium tricinctum]|uniref:DUF7730 domain-containing protein n=1 Tax=Fusarium tricinctum TaxID=61284 RepID=A0A8K0SB30_9HYPO|nr:hypothetical protein BKA59DRAFT_465984 [Fusarium tricinctum]